MGCQGVMGTDQDISTYLLIRFSGIQEGIWSIPSGKQAWQWKTEPQKEGWFPQRTKPPCSPGKFYHKDEIIRTCDLNGLRMDFHRFLRLVWCHISMVELFKPPAWCLFIGGFHHLTHQKIVELSKSCHRKRFHRLMLEGLADRYLIIFHSITFNGLIQEEHRSTSFHYVCGKSLQGYETDCPKTHAPTPQHSVVARYQRIHGRFQGDKKSSWRTSGLPYLGLGFQGILKRDTDVECWIW